MSTSEPTIRAVNPGDTYTALVEGGVRRKKAVSPGVVVSLPDRDIFIHPGELVLALVKLGWEVTGPPAPPPPAAPPRKRKR